MRGLILLIVLLAATVLLSALSTPAVAQPVSSSLLAQKTQAACSFLKSLYNPSLGLIRSTPNSSIHYIASDNLLVEKALSSCDPRTSQSINQSISHANKVMDKPRGFYITEGLNQQIDQAVRYYQENHNLKKVDRSIVVTALLDNETNWTEETLDLLLDKVIRQLTNRLTNR